MKNERLDAMVVFVQELTKLSKCTDKHTAAIITDADMTQVLSIGINGGPKGSKHQCLCKLDGKYTCIHAEANAIAKCTSSLQDKIMICSYSPCVTCASLIVNSGFSAVYYLEQYKDMTGIDILIEAGIAVSRYDALWDECDCLQRPHMSHETFMMQDFITKKVQEVTAAIKLIENKHDTHGMITLDVTYAAFTDNIDTLVATLSEKAFALGFTIMPTGKIYTGCSKPGLQSAFCDFGLSRC